MPRYYSEEHLKALYEQSAKVDPAAQDLLILYTYYPYKNDRAKEYARNGFARRVTTLSRCVFNLYELIPPETENIPSREVLYDAQIQLQAFMANSYGCIDNLAWIWVYENDLPEAANRNRVGFKKSHKEVRASLPAELLAYLESLDGWMEYVIEYRDALAHRIPLYIPPGMIPKDVRDRVFELEEQMTAALNALRTSEYDRLYAEQQKLFVFQPMMTHSVTEAKSMVHFHPQLLNDFFAIDELAKKLMQAIKSRAGLA